MNSVQNGDTLKTIITNTQKIKEMERRVTLLEESSKYWLRIIVGGIALQLIAVVVVAYLNWLLHGKP